MRTNQIWGGGVDESGLNSSESNSCCGDSLKPFLRIVATFLRRDKTFLRRDKTFLHRSIGFLCSVRPSAVAEGPLCVMDR